MNICLKVLRNLLFIFGVVVAIFSTSYINEGSSVYDGYTFGAYSGVGLALGLAPFTLLFFLLGERPSYLSIAMIYFILGISLLAISVTRIIYYIVYSQRVHAESSFPPENWQNVVAISLSCLFLLLCFIEVKRRKQRIDQPIG